MAGPSPPFQVPGHQWDSEKKRFFKVTPAKVAEAHTASTSARTDPSSDANKHPEPVKLPYLNDGSQPSSSAFPRGRMDPVSLRSLGGSILSQGTHFDRQATVSAYSQLALFQARRLPRASVKSFQTDASTDTMLVMLDGDSVIRLSPEHGTLERIVNSREEAGNFSMFYHGPTRHVWIKYELTAGEYDLDLILVPDAINRSILPIDPSMDIPIPNTVRAHSRYKTRIQGIRACAAHTVHPAFSQGRSQVRMAFCHGQTISIAQCGTEEGQFSLMNPKRVPRWPSDTTAVAFDLSKDDVYVGLRSGKVIAYHWKQPEGPFDVFGVQGKGAVTNIGVVDAALVVAWTSGELRLIDTVTYSTVRSYEGHRNSYHFDLGFALEPKLRLMALAGIDNKVRVWSLDDTVPLQTEAIIAFSRRNPTPWGEPVHLKHANIGSFLANIQFPDIVKCLHWNPRTLNGSEDSGQGVASRSVSSSPWSDLFIACGYLIYHFRWP